MHPGGASVFLDEDIAGQDATEQFFNLHRSVFLYGVTCLTSHSLEVLEKPQYKRLIIGQVENEKPIVKFPQPGDLSEGVLVHQVVTSHLTYSLVPYGEPSWLSQAYHSPYYKDVRL